MSAKIITGPALASLAALPAGSARCCVTSPPYWGLRDYGHDGQIGLEETPEAYVSRLVAVFAEVRRVLADDGTLWLNLGDSYGDKQLIGIPWRVAFALQADGWYLRSDIIWHKPNPMPESVRDRPTKAHEYVFMLSKNARYYWDQDAVREEVKPNTGVINGAPLMGAHRMTEGGRRTERREYDQIKGANRKSVWTIPTQPFPGAHFAVMPPALADRCIRAGSALGDTILDPFNGAGTTGMVARRLQRSYVGIEINPTFADMARKRIHSDAPLFNTSPGHGGDCERVKP